MARPDPLLTADEIAADVYHRSVVYTRQLLRTHALKPDGGELRGRRWYRSRAVKLGQDLGILDAKGKAVVRLGADGLPQKSAAVRGRAGLPAGVTYRDEETGAELWSMVQCAQRFGVQVETFEHWRSDPVPRRWMTSPVPDPVMHVDKSPLFRKPEIIAWGRSVGKLDRYGRLITT